VYGQDHDLQFAAVPDPTIERVVSSLGRLGVSTEVREFSDSTATAEAAARALGTSVERIVKSLVFATRDGQPILALVSGANRVDLQRLASLVGQPVGRANAEQVRQATGFSIGGVPPVGHHSPLPVYVDADLLRFDQVWAAAGTPNTVFAIAPDKLVDVTHGQVVALKA
jgi:Cys-tRNA(Pro) deacylase